MPSRQLCDQLLTHRTATALLAPQRQQLAPPVQVIGHGDAEALFKVDFPRGIKRICCPSDFRVAFDEHTGSREQFESVGPTRCIAPLPTEHPVTLPDDVKVLIFDPSARLVWMPAFRPLPQGAEERVVYRREGLFTAHMAVIVRPPPDQRIELRNQIFRFSLRIHTNERPGFAQEGVDTGAGGFHENRAVIISDVLAEKVKAVGDMGDLGLLGREDQAAFVEELFHQWADFGFQ